MYVFLNDDFIERSRAAVPIDDRGFLFGDAVYEVFRGHYGRFFEAEAHLRRLRTGMRELRLGDPSLADGIPDVAMRLIEMNELGDAPDLLVYVQVTRGVAPRKHAFPAPSTRPLVYVAVGTFVPKTDLCAHGVAAITHADLRWERCDLKTTNLLANVMANQAATEAGAYEAVLLRGDVVTEGTHSNAFGVVDGVLRTHPKTNRILPGITRDIVIDLARDAGVTVREEPMRVAELRSASEIFFTGTTTDVMPVVTLDGAPVGSGAPGPIGSALRDALEQRVRAQTGAGAARPGVKAGSTAR